MSAYLIHDYLNDDIVQGFAKTNRSRRLRSAISIWIRSLQVIVMLLVDIVVSTSWLE